MNSHAERTITTPVSSGSRPFGVLLKHILTGTG
jgi:hypothetical protein